MSYEDFTEYTKVDPDGELTVEANKIHVSDQSYDVDSRVYKDFGEDYFDGDFVHKFELTVTAGGAYIMSGIWAMANVSTGYKDMMEDPVIFLVVDNPLVAGDYSLMFVSIPGIEAESIDLLFNTKYYLTIERTGTTQTVIIRTGSHDGDIVDTIEGVNTVSPFRYLYAQFEMGEESP